VFELTGCSILPTIFQVNLGQWVPLGMLPPLVPREPFGDKWHSFLQAGCLCVTQQPTVYQSTETQRTDFRKEDRRNWFLKFVDPLPDS